MKIGLFFGSFNPIHIGHLAIANYFREFTDLDEIWFVVSPQNPWKKNESLLNQKQRVEMVKLAIASEEGYRVNDFEKNLPTPSYTYQSLLFLEKQYPLQEFVLIIGGDNLDMFPKWRNWKEIIELVQVYVYPRSGKEKALDHLQLIPAPRVEISSSEIREWIKEKKQVPYLTTPEVQKYINEHNLYC